MTDILHADLSSGTNLTSPTLPSLSSLSLSFPPSGKKQHKLTSAIRKCIYMIVHFKCVILEAKSYAGYTVIKGMKGWLKTKVYSFQFEY